MGKYLLPSGRNAGRIICMLEAGKILCDRHDGSPAKLNVFAQTLVAVECNLGMQNIEEAWAIENFSNKIYEYR